MLSSLRQTLFACIQGGRGPRHVASAVVLGVIAGCVTGWNLSLAAVLLLAALFNLRTKIFAVAWAAGLTMSWLATALTYRLGQFLLDGTPLGATLGSLGDNAWIAMFDWDRYTLVGGAAMGFGLALPAAKLIAKFAVRASAEVDGLGERWLRPCWYLPTSVGFALCAAAPWWLGPMLVERELLRQLAAASGAAVEAGNFRLSLWSGELEIDDLQFADPQHLDRDQLRVGRLTTQVRVGALLRGRLAADKLLMTNLRVDVARRQAADSQSGTAFRAKNTYSQLAQPSYSAANHELDLDGYVRDWPAVRERLTQLGRLVAGLESLAAADACGEASGEWPCGTRSDLAQAQPRVRIDSVRAEELPHAWGLGRKAVLEISGLTSQPAAAEEPTRVEIVAPEYAAEIAATLNLCKPGQKHNVRLAAYDCQLTELVEPATVDQTVIVSGGKLDLQGEGWMTRGRLELRLQLESKPLDVRVASRDRLAGIEGAVWDQGLRSLGSLRIEARLAGPWTAPVLSVNTQRLVEQFKHQLRAAGEHELVQSIEQQIASEQIAREQATGEQIASTPNTEPAAAKPAEPAEEESEFCTVSDDSAPTQVTNPFDGWRRARSADAAVSAKPAEPYQYPRTTAPDTDPADRFIATLDKPAASPAAPAPSVQVRAETSPVERTQYMDPDPPTQEPASRWHNRSLPGPINLVVGRQDQPYASQAEEADWPDETNPAEDGSEEEAAAPVQRTSLLARWADGVREKFRRSTPKKSDEELTLPPDLESQSAAGDEHLIDEALAPQPPVQAQQTWFQRLWR